MNHISIILAAVLATTGTALAQSDGKQPPAKQSAPSESSDAPGHDAQTGKPETGEKEKNDLGRKRSTDTKSPQDPGTPKSSPK